MMTCNGKCKLNNMLEGRDVCELLFLNLNFAFCSFY